MNNAGLAAVEKIQSLFPDKYTKFVILCGSGNNGGDGVVVFRELLAKNYRRSECYSVVPPRTNALNHQIKNVNAPVKKFSGVLPAADVYIDALFGIGLSKEIHGSLAQLIEELNRLRRAGRSQTISLDIPSGLDADTGAVRGAAVEADHTLTFGVRKLGQLIQDGPRVCGRVHKLNIGFSKEAVTAHANSHFVFTHRDFVAAFPNRKSTSNKSTHGHVKVWAGSPGMWGAALLTARAAYRVGSGYVSLQSEDSAVFSDVPELLVEKRSPIDNRFTYAVGPGWGTGSEQESQLRLLHANHIEKVILDADALTNIAYASPKIALRSDWILTPHTKELSRLLKIRDVTTIESNRPQHARDAAKALGAIVVLKGFRTLVAVEGNVFIIPTGNAALAKAGSGDVLTGIVSGLRAQGLSAPLAALSGAYLHGWMADLWVQKNHPNSLMPSDLLKGLPRLLQRLLTQ